MQGGDPGVEPGVAHQGREAIDALQQQVALAVLADHGCVLGAARRPAAQPIAGQGVLQGAGGQFGRTPMAGHRGWAVPSHGLEAAEAVHEALIQELLPAPQQGAGPQGPGPPEGHGLGAGSQAAAIAEQLQGPGLGAPGAQGATRNDPGQVPGQGRGAAHGPDAGWGPGLGGDDAAVSTGKHPGMVQNLEAGCGEQPAALVLRQASCSQPAGGAAAGAGQVGWGCRWAVTPQANAGPVEQPFAHPVGGPGAQVQLGAAQQQLRFQSPTPQGQGKFHRRGSPTLDPQIGLIQLAAPLQERIQGLDRHGGAGELVGLRAHIEAEPVPAEAGPFLQVQFPGLEIEARDLCLHEGHPCHQAEAAQVDGAGLFPHQAGH